MDVTAASWPLRCPVCRAALGDLPTPESTVDVLTCTSCATSFHRQGPVWDLLPAARAAHYDTFLADYTRIRHAEGRGSDDPRHYRALPEVPKDDPLAGQWRIRARTWRHLRRHVLPRLERAHWWQRRRSLRIVDVGAGVGWLSHRLAGEGHHPLAIDITTDVRDGLGAVVHYEVPVPAVRAEFDHLPLADACADVVLFDASLHYSVDYAVTLGEATRVLAPGGRIIVLESPVYRRDASGRAMVAERHAQFEQRFGTRSEAIASVEYLTPAALTAVAGQVGLRWQRSVPWYGWRWAMRPLIARIKRRRAPSRFHVLLAHRHAEHVRPVRSSTRRVRRAIGSVLAVLVLGAGAEAAYLWHELGQIERVHVAGLGTRPVTTVPDPAAPPTIVAGAPGTSPPATGPAVAATAAGTAVPAPTDPAMNILLVGVDSTEGLAEDDRVRIGRSDSDRRTDTIMIVRLDPARTAAAVLSIPRDWWVRLGGDGPYDKVNAAFAIGGPDLLVRTLTANLGITIDHYAEINFAQFERLVDVVDGVPMSFPTPAQDKNSGLYIGEPGCVTLKGAQALAYVRSRHLEVQVDGEWVEDRSADLSRIRRQQDFIRRALSRATAVRNPIAFNQLVDRGVAAITVDDGLGTFDLLRLAREFRSFGSDALLTSSLPVVVGRSPNGLSIVNLVAEEAEPWLDLYRGVDPDLPAHVSADVRGTGATTVADSLNAIGFRATAATGDERADATATPTLTTIRFRAIERYRAELLARYLDGPIDLVADDAVATTGVVIELGRDVAVRAAPTPGRSFKAAPARTQVGVVPGERSDLCR